MSPKRIFRDIGILAILCSAFYAMLMMVGQMNDQQNSLFSRNRIMADRFFRAQQWPAAAKHYELLLEEDPFNGLAWNCLAHSRLASRIELEDEINDALAASMNPEQMEVLYLEAKTLEEQAIAAYENAVKFLRYRRRSLFNMAHALVFKGNWESAMDCLDQFLDEGYFTDQGFDMFRHLGRGGQEMVDAAPEEDRTVRLHQFKRFWEIVERESSLRKRSFTRYRVH